MSPRPKIRKDIIGLHGDFWTRFLLRLIRVLPGWLCLLITRPIALVFYCLAAQQRRAVISNLRALRPELGLLALWLSGWRVFTQFALTYMDRLWSLHLDKPLKWRMINAEHLKHQLELPEGLLLFITHSGNYDIGAILFGQNFQRQIHTVRVAEETKSLQEFRAAEFEQVERENPQVHVLYAGDDWRLGLKLCQLVGDGGVVAIQGDRPVSGSAMVMDFEGINFTLPRGPFVLARMSRVPCYPISLYRVGRCEYGLLTGPAFFDGNARQSEKEIAQAWLRWLTPTLKRHWDQWFVFEPILKRLNTEPLASPSPAP